MIKITGRVTRNVNEHAAVLRKMELKPFLRAKIREGLLKGADSIRYADEAGKESLFTFDRPYLDYQMTIEVQNEEFKATFLELLDEYTHQSWDYRSNLTKQKLRAFYNAVKELDRIYSEFKARTRLPTYPKNIVVVKAGNLIREFTNGTREYWVGEYFPEQHSYFKRLEDYGVRSGAHDISIYAEKNSLIVQGIFIHELIHHLMNIEGMERAEDPLKMLAIAKKHMPASWLATKFEEYTRAVIERKRINK